MTDQQMHDEMFRPEPLDPELRRCVSVGTMFPMLQHPLVVLVPFSSQLNRQANRLLREKRKLARESWAERNFDLYLTLHERPFRLQALLQVLDEGKPTRAEAVAMVQFVWTDSEGPGVNRRLWRRLLRDHREDGNLGELPETFAVYRGADRKEHTTGQFGLSWTLDKDRARWFAKRFGGFGVVLSTTIKRDDALLFADNRGEREVVVDYTTIKKHAVEVTEP